MHLLSALIIAFSTYSRIPMPQVGWSDENRRYAMCFFPLVGAAVGLALWGWLALSDALSCGPCLRGAVGAALPLLVTGGIHMDGFMDTCDALASHQSRERRLEILKDSRVGAFAAMGCAGYLTVFAGALSEMPARMGPAMLSAFVVSRALSALALVWFRSARPGGMLDGFARTAHRRRVSAAAAAYLLLGAILWVLVGGLTTAAAALAVAAACFEAYRRMADRCFGGVTGDLAGWFVLVTELALALTVVLGGKLA